MESSKHGKWPASRALPYEAISAFSCGHVLASTLTHFIITNFNIGLIILCTVTRQAVTIPTELLSIAPRCFT